MDLEEVTERLYGLPPAEFVRERDAAARELRRAGQRDAADQVKRLRKPSAAAGAVNRLVREHRGEVEQYLEAAAALRDAQFSGEGDLAAAGRDEREALERLLGLGGEAVRQSLLAAAVDDDASRRLLEARLEKELEPAGFGTLLAHAPPKPVKLGDAAPRPSRPRGAPAKAGREPAEAPAGPAGKSRQTGGAGADGRSGEAASRAEAELAAARDRLEDAEAALAAAEAEERQARRHWDDTQAELRKARAAADKARRDLDRLYAR